MSLFSVLLKGYKMANNKMDAVLFTGDNRIEDLKLEAYITHLESPKTAEAWAMNPRQQCKDEKTGNYIQFLSPISYKPLKIYRNSNGNKESKVEDNVAVISAQTEDEEMAFLENRQHKDSRLLWLGIILAAVALTFLIAIWMILSNRNSEPATALLLFALPFVPRKNKKEEPSIDELQKDANAMIIDEKKKKRIFRHLEDNEIPQDSFEKKYKGEIYHFLGKDLEEKYWVIDTMPEMVIGQAPIDLYIAKHCAEEVAEVFGLSASWRERIKIGVFVVLIILIVIFTFLTVTASSGGVAQ